MKVEVANLLRRHSKHFMCDSNSYRSQPWRRKTGESSFVSIGSTLNWNLNRTCASYHPNVCTISYTSKSSPWWQMILLNEFPDITSEIHLKHSVFFLSTWSNHSRCSNEPKWRSSMYYIVFLSRQSFPIRSIFHMKLIWYFRWWLVIYEAIDTEMFALFRIMKGYHWSICSCLGKQKAQWSSTIRSHDEFDGVTGWTLNQTIGNITSPVSIAGRNLSHVFLIRFTHDTNWKRVRWTELIDSTYCQKERHDWLWLLLVFATTFSTVRVCIPKLAVFVWQHIVGSLSNTVAWLDGEPWWKYYLMVKM